MNTLLYCFKAHYSDTRSHQPMPHPVNAVMVSSSSRTAVPHCESWLQQTPLIRARGKIIRHAFAVSAALPPQKAPSSVVRRVVMCHTAGVPVCCMPCPHLPTLRHESINTLQHTPCEPPECTLWGAVQRWHKLSRVTLFVHPGVNLRRTGPPCAAWSLRI